jgi:hypothetical protein
MVGIPQNLNTHQDWINAQQYALNGTSENRGALITMLEGIRNTGTIKVLKEGVTAPPEEQTPDDYEDAIDELSPLVLSGLTIEEIDAMIAELQGAL